jgi:deoxyhypusine synthase
MAAPNQRRKYLSGKNIEPIKVWKGMKVGDLVDTYAGMGFNARRLAEAAQLVRRMVEADATVCLTLSGAMTPVGMSGALVTLIENGWVDWAISTGANLYHDLHRAYSLPMKQGHFLVDDDVLEAAGIARIYDVFIEEEGTMLRTDAVVLAAVNCPGLPQPASTADLHFHLGRTVSRTAARPEKSFLARAADLSVPVYCPSPGDSSIGMNMILNHLEGAPLTVDPILDILETSALVRSARKTGALMIGGGAPKNFFMQTQPTLWQILGDDQGGHDYFVQLTTDAPHWGGLSGATPSEARSWGKIKSAQLNNVTAYVDASIGLPLIAAYLQETTKPRKPRRLMENKAEMLEELKKKYLKNTSLRAKVGMCLPISKKAVVKAPRKAVRKGGK